MCACTCAVLTHQPWKQNTAHFTTSSQDHHIWPEAKMEADRQTHIWALSRTSRKQGLIHSQHRSRDTVNYWAELDTTAERADELRTEEDEDERTDRQASHKASDLPVPECRFILNAVSTAGPSSKNRDRKVREWCRLPSQNHTLQREQSTLAPEALRPELSSEAENLNIANPLKMTQWPELVWFSNKPNSLRWLKQAVWEMHST